MGCCSLRVEHIKLHEDYDGQQFVVEFDFLGKDSIRYYNRVQVEKRVFKNLQLFMENKQDGDDLFDRLNVNYRFVCDLFHLELWKLMICHVINLKIFQQLIKF